MMFLLQLCLATANAGLVRREEKFQRYNEDTMEDDLKEFMEKVTGLAECNWKFTATIEACEVCVQNECGQEMKRYSSPKEPLNQVERGFKDASSGLVSGLESVVKKNRRVFHTGTSKRFYVIGSISDHTNGNGNSYNKHTGYGNGNGNNYQNGDGNSNGDNNQNGNGNGNVYGYGYGYRPYYSHIDTGIQPGVTATKRFGEMRREVNAATRHCMDECTDCQKFLLNTTEMIRNVCGPRLLDADTNSKAKMERVMEYLDKLN